jgi:competence protein ComEC
MAELVIILVILLTSAPLSNAKPPSLIFWNVGQGLWTTFSEIHYCIHFDMGGEFLPGGIDQECGKKKNYVFYSHWDWDHIGLSLKAKRRLSSLCLMKEPAGQTNSRKRLFLEKIPNCKIPFHSTLLVELKSQQSAKTSNAASRIYLFHDELLLPGDSPSFQEKRWIWSLRAPLAVQLLALGHHGSRTSTSHFLLGRLPNLKMAIASARQKRYGHPHKEVKARLKQAGVSLLRTEIWGTIRLFLK